MDAGASDRSGQTTFILSPLKLHFCHESNAEISERMILSPKSVKKHLSL